MRNIFSFLIEQSRQTIGADCIQHLSHGSGAGVTTEQILCLGQHSLRRDTDHERQDFRFDFLQAVGIGAVQMIQRRDGVGGKAFGSRIPVCLADHGKDPAQCVGIFGVDPAGGFDADQMARRCVGVQFDTEFLTQILESDCDFVTGADLGTQQIVFRQAGAVFVLGGEDLCFILHRKTGQNLARQRRQTDERRRLKPVAAVDDCESGFVFPVGNQQETAFVVVEIGGDFLHLGAAIALIGIVHTEHGQRQESDSDFPDGAGVGKDGFGDDPVGGFLGGVGGRNGIDGRSHRTKSPFHLILLF